MTIHSRRAVTDVLDALTRHPDAGVPILHWFSGTKTELFRAVDMGCWFSVGPAMMLGKRGRDLVSAMPPERLLTETDGPFASVGGRPLGPAEVSQAQDLLAACWNVDALEASYRVLASFRSLAASAVGGPIANA